MAVFLLVVIYFAFISLGLPDSMFGSTWPAIRLDFHAGLGIAGIVAMIVSAGTIVSSLMSARLQSRFGTGKVTFVSVLLTAVSLLGYALSPSFTWFFILAIPLGLGAGAVDAGLNAYVANHYKSRHMSWLHCFWGVGATLGPVIMSQFIAGHRSWRNGYFTVSLIQFVLAALLLFTLPLWGKAGRESAQESAQVGAQVSAQSSEAGPESGQPDHKAAGTKPTHPLKIPGIKIALLSFLFYCAIEYTMGLWGSSFLVNIKKLDAATAASWVALFYGGITAGRFVSGFITMRLSNKQMIRAGECCVLLGALLLLLPLPVWFTFAGFILIGLGCAPIYPCMLHETPVRFGRSESQRIMGYQMAVAYTGGTILPPLFGWVASVTTVALFPLFIFINIAVMLAGSEYLNRYLQRRKGAADHG